MEQQDPTNNTMANGGGSSEGTSNPGTGAADRRRDVPVWLTGPLILLLVIGGGLFIAWQWRGGWGSGDTVVIDPAVAGARDDAPLPAAARPVRVRPAVRNNDGVRRLQRTVHQVRAGQALVRITERPAPKPPAPKAGAPAAPAPATPAEPTYTFSLRYLTPNVVGPEVQDLVMAGWRLTRERALAETTKLTGEQVAKLKALGIQLDVTLKGDDAERLKTLWNEYQAASSKDDAEQKLVAAVAQIGDREVEPRRQAMEQWATQVKGLLTAEQWTAYKQARLQPPRRPATVAATATRPATPPAAKQAMPAPVPAAQPAAPPPAIPAAPATAPIPTPTPDQGA